MNTEWRPIETAPKDGAKVLLGGGGAHGPESVNMQVGRWNSVLDMWEVRVRYSWVEVPENWMGTCFEPTHWTPLPSSAVLLLSKPVAPTNTQIVKSGNDCQHCRWWFRDKCDDGTGRCRAHAPQIQQRRDSTNEASWAAWPETYSDEWCAEWKARDEAAQGNHD